MSKKQSKWKRNSDGKTVPRNALAAFWHSRPVELMKSPALRCLSSSGHLVLLRIEIELRQHAGKCNGNLIVTQEQFAEFGVNHNMVPAALREVEAVGIISIKRGRGGNAEHREPNRFTLNYLCGAEDESERLDAWKRFGTLKEAKAVALAARKAKDPQRVAWGRRNAARKNISQPHKVGLDPTPQSGLETENSPAPQSGVTAQPHNVGSLSILSGGGGERAVVSSSAPRQGSSEPEPAGIGHNQGPPLVPDDLDIPQWLQRANGGWQR
jgi:hypothetical protein